MARSFRDITSAEAWRVLVDAAIVAAEDKGFTLRRMPGRGRSTVYEVERNGNKRLAAIRTTRDRLIAFPPMADGWKTLDDVKLVFVAAVDVPEAPANIEVLMLPADEVRARFDAALAARVEAGHHIVENFGMWISLDADDRGLPASVGAGIADKFQPIAVFPIDDELLASVDGLAAEKYDGAVADPVPIAASAGQSPSGTISEILEKARTDIATLAGVSDEKVKLDLKIED